MDTVVRVIEILGPGCARCREAYRVVRRVVDQEALECTVEKNESIDRMVDLGALASPAIAFDGHVVMSGEVPNADDVRRLLGLS